MDSFCGSEKAGTFKFTIDVNKVICFTVYIQGSQEYINGFYIIDLFLHTHE